MHVRLIEECSVRAGTERVTNYPHEQTSLLGKNIMQKERENDA